MIWYIVFIIGLVTVYANVINRKFNIRLDNTKQYLITDVDYWLKMNKNSPKLVKTEFPRDMFKVKKWKTESKIFHFVTIYVFFLILVLSGVLFFNEFSFMKIVTTTALSFITASIAVGINVTFKRISDVQDIENFYRYYVENMDESEY